MSSPKITVFMAAYNSSAFISESISSVLSQSYGNFELLIVNDGSNDKTVDIVNSFQDERIRLIHNSRNRGLVYTRNRVLEEARGEYIAVLDSDDIAVPERIQLQYEFMSHRPDVALCSGHAEVIDESGAFTGEKFIVPTGDHVEMHMLFGNPFVNSAAIFKTSVFRELKGYGQYPVSEDFDFFLRLAEKYPVTNLDHVLVKYRKHKQSTSSSTRNLIRKTETEILKDIHQRLGIETNDAFAEVHYHLFSRNYQAKSFAEFLSVLTALKQANRRSHRYPREPFERLLFNKWQEIIAEKKAGKKTLPLLLTSELSGMTYLSFKQLRKAFKKSFWAYLKN